MLPQWGGVCRPNISDGSPLNEVKKQSDVSIFGPSISPSSFTSFPLFLSPSSYAPSLLHSLALSLSFLSSFPPFSLIPSYLLIVSHTSIFSFLFSPPIFLSISSNHPSYLPAYIFLIFLFLLILSNSLSFPFPIYVFLFPIPFFLTLLSLSFSSLYPLHSFSSPSSPLIPLILGFYIS